MSSHYHLIFICIVLFFLTVNAFTFTKKSGLSLSWKNCGPSSDSIQLKSLAITPDPIQVPGNFNVTGSIDIGSEVPTDIHANVLLERKIGPIYVKIPCVDDFGSCDYGNACDLWSQICPTYAAQYGLPCQCPISADTYSVSNANIIIDVSAPPEFLGEYRAVVNIISKNVHLGCVDIGLSIGH